MRLRKRLVPTFMKQRLRDRFRMETRAVLDPNSILGVLHTPPSHHARGHWLTWDEAAAKAGDGQLPLPPPAFRMGQSDDDSGYLA